MKGHQERTAEGSTEGRPLRGRRRYSPSAADVGFARKISTNASLLAAYARGRGRAPALVLERLDRFDRLARAYLGRGLADLRILEIGFGARPWMLRALLAMGSDAWGVDVEAPVLDGSVRELRAIYRVNGLERAAKSAIRHALFDGGERRVMDRLLRGRGWAAPIPRERFIVADATALDWPRGDLDLVISEDVFEHIPREGLERLVPAMSNWLRTDGLALICPNVFTGIAGGHHLEWSPSAIDAGRAGRGVPPWDHLRARRHPANTYLNELSRADYRHLFASDFETLDEVVVRPGLGRQYLTPDVAAELTTFADEELFSNQVLFVMRPRPAHVTPTPC